MNCMFVQYTINSLILLGNSWFWRRLRAQRALPGIAGIVARRARSCIIVGIVTRKARSCTIVGIVARRTRSYGIARIVARKARSYRYVYRDASV
jgi:hypothetical protein